MAPAAPPKTAVILAIEGADQPFPSVDQDGRVVYVPQPASRADMHALAPGSDLHGVIVTIDLMTNTIRVLTDASQVVTLLVPRGDLVGTRIGDVYTFEGSRR